MSTSPSEDLSLEQWLEAAKRGDAAFIADYLNRGFDINAANGNHATALMNAVRNRHLDLIRILLDRGADLRPEDSYGFTALTHAIIVSRTWDGWYRIDDPDPRPLELLLAAGGRYSLCDAVLLNDLGLARTRLEEGADPDTGQYTYHGPLLKVAAELGHVGIVDLLLDWGANLEATDDLGQRALLSAARRGKTEAVRRLLERGADLNAVDWSGQSALSNAAIDGHHELAELLLSVGATRGIVAALALDDRALFEALLDQSLRDGMDIDWISDGRFRLAMVAVQRGKTEFVRLLLDRGALIHHEWQDARTLLGEAARCGHLDVAQLLIDRGADLHAVGRDGLTALAWALQEDRREIAALLRDRGALR